MQIVNNTLAHCIYSFVATLSFHACTMHAFRALFWWKSCSGILLIVVAFLSFLFVLFFFLLTWADSNRWLRMWTDSRESHSLANPHHRTIDSVGMVCAVENQVYPFVAGTLCRMQIDRWLKTFSGKLHLDCAMIGSRTTVRNCVCRAQQMLLAREIALLMLYCHRYSRMSRVANVVQSFENRIWPKI